MIFSAPGRDHGEFELAAGVGDHVLVRKVHDLDFNGSIFFFHDCSSKSLDAGEL